MPLPVMAGSSGERNFGIALAVSLVLHAVLLSLHFKYPDASRAFQEKALEVIAGKQIDKRIDSGATIITKENAQALLDFRASIK